MVDECMAIDTVKVVQFSELLEQMSQESVCVQNDRSQISGDCCVLTGKLKISGETTQCGTFINMKGSRASGHQDGDST